MYLLILHGKAKLFITTSYRTLIAYPMISYGTRHRKVAIGEARILIRKGRGRTLLGGALGMVMKDFYKVGSSKRRYDLRKEGPRRENRGRGRKKKECMSKESVRKRSNEDKGVGSKFKVLTAMS
jgi:hypothetical protein